MQHRPNLVFVLADDLGYADLGCYGARASVSPHLDRLAAGGITFDWAYSNSPVCSPTRFALMSGRYQYRLPGGSEEPLTFSRMKRAPGLLGFPPEHPSLPSLLRGAGYRTALVGKWHLGTPPEFDPLRSGYEEHFGCYGGGLDYHSYLTMGGDRDLWDNGQPAPGSGYLTDRLTDRAVDFVQRCARSDEPFLLSLHYTAPHWPWQTREDEAESQRIGSAVQHADGGSVDTYRRMVLQMDEGIGRLVDALRANGQLDNTLIVFTSDNGGERFSDSWPLIGGKMDLTEGGIRVPCIAHWPARVPAGRVSAQLSMTMDWVATMLDAAGVAPHPDWPLDGLSLLPMLLDPAQVVPRELFWRMKYREQWAMRADRWKYLVVDGHEYLFDLHADQRERANVARRYPERLDAMRATLLQWSRTMPAIPGDAEYSLVVTDRDMPHWHAAGPKR
ncbi:MAG: sulfatase-like hydrolase/transferase [Rhodoferax sp.]